MPTRQFGSYDIEVDRDGHLADASQCSFITGQSIVVDGGALARLSTE